MATKNPPEEVKLSQAEGEALIERLETDRLTTADRRLLVKLIQLYCWLTLALRETRLSLKRLKVALFGEGRPKRPPPGGGNGGSPGVGAGSLPGQDGLRSSADKPNAKDAQDEACSAEHRRGHRRQGAEAYWGAQPVGCRHKEWAAGQRCPVCGLGTLYRLPFGVEIHIAGNAL